MWSFERWVPPEARHGHSIGQLVHRWRLARGWSQRDLERISGVTQSMISRLEAGRVSGIHLSTLGRLAWALQAEDALLRALAPDGGAEIQELAAHGFGPTADQIDLILRKRPRGRKPSDQRQAPGGR
jgi:transcriptional regulator with XRE-family HTH domain